MFAALGLQLGDYAAQVEEALRMFPYCQTKVRLDTTLHITFHSHIYFHFRSLWLNVSLFTLCSCHFVINVMSSKCVSVRPPHDFTPQLDSLI